MKRRSFGLSPREISVLISVRGGERPRKSIGLDLGVSSPELTRLVKSLESKGFVAVRRHGMSRSVSLSDLKHASQLRRLLDEYGHMNLERILSLASLEVLSCLAARPGSKWAAIVSFSGVSERTLQTVLERLRELGIVRISTNGTYAISERFALIADFVRGLDDYSNQRLAMEFSTDSVVVWQRSKDFIIRTCCMRETAGFKKTAFSAFESWGVPLFFDRNYYYHTSGSWRRTLDEVFLQSLLIRPRSARENMAILMLWERNALWRKLDRLRERARALGLDDELETIVAYFKDPEKNRGSGFPRISELKERLGREPQ